jgi:3-methylfumaryl-CoA hydratase
MNNQAPTLDPAVLKRWIGNCEIKSDTIEARPANFLRATLNHTGNTLVPGDPLPAGYHWLYFLEAPTMDELGNDGHTALGGFLPPVALPRRMWAGARLKFHREMKIGESLEKKSVVEKIVPKTGRSGDLCFVTVRHEYSCNGDPRLEEEHDIVYRGEKIPTGIQGWKKSTISSIGGKKSRETELQHHLHLLRLIFSVLSTPRPHCFFVILH